MNRMPRIRPLEIAYGTNVHRGESLREVLRWLGRSTLEVHRRVLGPGPCGLELHVGISLARELLNPRALETLQTFLLENELRLFSVNAFPLLPFHARRVKEKVYRPSWAEPARSLWTRRIARVFAKLLPESVEGTLSTLAGGLGSGRDGPEELRSMARGYVEVIQELSTIETNLGKTIALAVEPEPGTTMETAHDVICFFESALFPEAVRAWRKEGFRPSQCEERLRKFFTVNLDACHLSVLFEDLRENYRRLRAAGIRVSKVHVTSALCLENPHGSPRGYRRLLGMREPRYVHQFAGRDRDGKVTWRGMDLDELPERLERHIHPEVVELRCHYHVPLYRKDWSGLKTTRDETLALLGEVLREGSCRQLVVETYTWPILEGRPPQLEEGIARELRWLLRAVWPRKFGRGAGRRSGRRP